MPMSSRGHGTGGAVYSYTLGIPVTYRYLIVSSGGLATCKHDHESEIDDGLFFFFFLTRADLIARTR